MEGGRLSRPCGSNPDLNPEPSTSPTGRSSETTSGANSPLRSCGLAPGRPTCGGGGASRRSLPRYAAWICRALRTRYLACTASERGGSEEGR